MDRRCCCLAMAEVRKRYPNYLPKIEKACTRSWEAPIVEPDALEKTVVKMVTEAGYYKNWEKALETQGVALVLGNIWGES